MSVFKNEPGGKAILLSLAAFACLLTAAPAHADRWEKYPGKGSKADWERSWAIVTKQAYPLTQQNKWKEAMPLLNRAIAIYPHDSFYHFLLAMALGNTGNKQAAIPEFEKAMQLDPNDDHCPYYLGLLYNERKEFAKSKPLFEKAIKASPANPDPWVALFTTTQEADGPKAALDVYNRSKKIPIKDVMMLHNAGAIQLAVNKNYKEAEAIFRDVLKVDPKFYPSKAGLGETLLRKGQYRDALKILLECQKMPDSKEASRAKELSGLIRETRAKLAPKKKRKPVVAH